MSLTSENIRAELERVEREASEAYAELKKVRDGVVASGINPLGGSTEEQAAFDKVDEAGKVYDTKRQEAEELKAKLARLEEIDGVANGQPASRRPVNGGQAQSRGNIRLMTPGRRFIEAQEYRELEKNGAFISDTAFASAAARGLSSPVEIIGRDEMELLLASWNGPQIGATTVTGGGSTSAGPFIQNDLIPGFISYRRKRALAAAMVGQGTTDSDVVEYVSQSAPTDAAAETAEDSAAPESTYAFATNTTNVREITHFVPVTLRAMADHGQIRTIIDNQLTLGALDRLDTQVVSGNGSGQNLQGIYNASGIGTQALGGFGRAEAIHKAITAIRVAAGVLSEPDAIGMHPNDFEDLILEQDANGNYIFGPPSQQESRTCWGVPLVTSTVFTSGTPLVGDYMGSATLWLREALSVTTGLDGNDFTKRRVSMLAALRVAFAVTRAGGFCTVTGF